MISKRNKHIIIIITFLILVLLSFSCGPARLVHELKDPVQFSLDSRQYSVLKVHMKNGNLYLLDNYLLARNADTLKGYGFYYNPNRQVISSSNFKAIPEPLRNKTFFFKIPISEIALIETNEIKGFYSKRFLMCLVAVPTVFLTIMAIALLNSPGIY
jgi:hypothetical protein